ncbi:MAG: hypothetical protein K8R41_02275 [Bacteroidales bacterium]|nr:hypothetical protein [Bacteroidales bacterium]
MNSQKHQPTMYEAFVKKATLKQYVYSNTLSTIKLIKETIKEIVSEYKDQFKNTEKLIPFEYKERSKFEIELKFGGDVLLFIMHTNIFEFPREHEVMKTSYIKDDKDRSYCGIIHIYNFLADSFKYNRINDVGYLIGRIFINKDKYYFIEGKKELGLLYNNFGNIKMDKKVSREIIESSINYTVNFDLLTPPYQNVQEIYMQDIKYAIDNMALKTGKRLGFKFQADQ